MEETQEEYLKNSEELKAFNGLGGFRLFTSYDDIMAAPDPVALVSVNDTPVLWKNGVNVITAPVKTGKTSLIALLLYGEGVRRRVLWIDGEQPLTDIKRTYRTLQQYSGDLGRIEGLEIMMLINREREARLNDVVEAINEHRPEVIVIDGLQQLMRTKDDELAAGEVIDKLTNEADKVGATIVVSVQISRTSERDGVPQIKGHLGSMAQERAAQILYLKKNPDTGALVLQSKGTRRNATMPELHLDRDALGRLQWIDAQTAEAAFIHERVDIDPRELDIIRAIAKEHNGEITSGRLQDGMNIDRNRAKRMLLKYSDTAFTQDARRPLRKHGEGRNTYYTLKDEGEALGTEEENDD